MMEGHLSSGVAREAFVSPNDDNPLDRFQQLRNPLSTTMSTSGSPPPPPLNDPSAPLDPTSSTSALPSQPEPSTLTTSSSKSVKSSKDKGKKKAPSAGIVYISRIPPGMTPQKIKHLMGRWGDVGKVYAQKDDASAGKKGKNASTSSLPRRSAESRVPRK
jgi:hypothetical protein